MEYNLVEKKRTENYGFVDTIRCIAMIGIVFEHSTFIGWFKYDRLWETFLQVSFLEFFKFATISFFLIAGFLINHKFTEYTPYAYLRNRFKSTIGPWFFWLNCFILIHIAGLVFLYSTGHHKTVFEGSFMAFLMEAYRYAVFETSFWFILSFLISIAILLIFKRHLYSLVFGAILGLITLFYSVNVYYEWIIPRHTTAVFGYVFFLWLGALLNKNYTAIHAFIQKTPISWFIYSTLLTFIIAVLETANFKINHPEGAFNTLAISNILYSLSFFALLLKKGPVSFINEKLEPRKTTFGVYLIHHIILVYLITELFRPFHIPSDHLPVAEAMAYSILRFLVAYSLSWFLVKLFLKTRFKWSIGA